MDNQQLGELLAAPAESTTLDFKERLNWNTPAARLEVARDIACLANRNGGLLVIGVAERDTGGFDPIGLQAGDPMPDVTELGNVLARHFDPPPRAQITVIEHAGREFGIIRVEEFDRTPHICHRIGQVDNNVVLRPGDIYRRTDSMSCARVESADGMRAMIESSVGKTGAIVRTLLGEHPAAPPPAAAPLAAPTDRLIDGASVVRACDMFPAVEGHEVEVSVLPGFLRQATVRSVGGTLVPRSIDIERRAPSEIVREPHRIMLESQRDDPAEAGATSSVVELSTTLSIRLRERLWEREGEVDATSLIAYILGCLWFGQQFYEAAGVDRFRIAVGLLSPVGQKLAVNQSRYSPLIQSYVATSVEDLMIVRDIAVADLQTQDGRANVGFGIAVELLWYFGFDLPRATYDAHLEQTRQSVPGI